MAALPRYEILTSDGRRLALGDPAVLADTGPSFLDCASLSGVVLTLPEEAEVASVRAYFVPGGRTDTLNSWVRDLQLPPPGALQLDGVAAEERRFAWRATAGGPGPDAVIVELRPPPQRCTEIVLRLTPGPWGLVHLSAHSDRWEGTPWEDAPVRDLPRYPESQAQLPRRGDPLAEQLLLRGEPSLPSLWELALPYRGGALLGVPEGPLAQVNWDGGIVVRCPDGACDRLWLKLDLGPLNDLGADIGIELLAGWLPIAVLRGAGGRLRQTAFVDLAGQLRVRWEIAAGEAPAPRLRAARSRLLQAEGGPAWRAVHEPVAVEAPGPEGGECRLGPLRGALRPIPGGAAAGPGLELLLPLAPGAGADQGFDAALAALRAHWEGYLAAGVQLDLPDPFFARLWRALSVHNRLFIRGGQMRYGLFPGVYEDGIFGVEEGWNIVALAQYGQGRLAEEVLARTFFDPTFLAKEGQHHQYRNGLALTYALDLFRLTGGADWLRGLYPTVQESADWIAERLRSTQVLEHGQRPPHYGLMPKHTYGGDLKDPAYSLYGSSACWRGLRDAALIAQILGDPTTAARYTAEAGRARWNMREAARRIYNRDGRPPFLPFRVGETSAEPSAGDYHQLFASLVLETALFGWDDLYVHDMMEYLIATGRQAAGVARFDQWFGRLGVDAEYSRGVQLAHLVHRRFDRFWLGLVGQVGLSCDPFTFTSPETAIVRCSRQDHQDRMRTLAQNPRRFDSDPCSAGTAVMLQYLRYLLCFEERDEEDLPTGRLWLGPAAPRAWFQPGSSFGAQGMPTAFGPVSFRCSSDERRVRYEIRSQRPVDAELFLVDADGQRRSVRWSVAGAAEVELPRRYG